MSKLKKRPVGVDEKAWSKLEELGTECVLGDKLLTTRLAYAVLHHQIKSGNLSFWRRAWLFDLYTRTIKPKSKTVLMKGVQLGVSELFIVTLLYLAGELGLWILYTLPIQPLRNRFVRMRIDPVIAGSAFYQRKQQESIGTVDGVEAKFFGKGAIVFSGSDSPREFVEFPADAVFIDEFDRCSQEYLPMATDRYANSNWKILFEAGNPTVGEFGIAKEYDESSRSRWHIKCTHCNHYQYMNWYDNIVAQTGKASYELLDTEWSRGCGRDIHVLCSKCGKPLDRYQEEGSEWVPEIPDHPVEGYHIDQLVSPTSTIEEMAYDTKAGFFAAVGDATKFGVFTNSRLGLPYSPPGANLTPELLAEASKVPYEYGRASSHPTTMGLDVGNTLNYVISDHITIDGIHFVRTLDVGVKKSFEEIDTLMHVYNIKCCVVDAFPETREAKRFQGRHPGLVWLCKFRKSEAVEEKAIDQVGYVATYDRTQLLDSMVADFMNGVRRLPTHSKMLDKGKVWAQLRAPKRVFDEKAQRFKWVEGSKADHYFLAFSYDTAAWKLYTQGMGSCLSLTDYKPMIEKKDVDPKIKQAREDYDWLYGD